jgi:hypothetical protein
MTAQGKNDTTSIFMLSKISPYGPFINLSNNKLFITDYNITHIVSYWFKITAAL